MSDSEHLDFRLLKYIVAIAEAGTFTAAAARLHVSQSALSTQIRTLEFNLGIKIFERDRGAVLTQEGKVLVRYGRHGLLTREHIVQTVQAIHAGRMAPLRLAFTSFVLHPLLKDVSDTYRDLIPDGDIMPESGDTEEVVARVKDGECDAALVTLPVKSDSLSITIVERDRLVVCMRSDDPLATQDEVTAQAIDGKICDFVYQKYHPAAHNRLIEMLLEIGVTPKPCRPTVNIDHVQWMVKQGACYSLIRARRPLAAGLTTRPLANTDWTVDTAFVCREDHGNPALALLIEELAKRRPQPAERNSNKPVVSVAIRRSTNQSAEPKDEEQLGLFRSKTGS